MITVIIYNNSNNNKFTMQSRVHTVFDEEGLTIAACFLSCVLGQCVVTVYGYGINGKREIERKR